MQKKKTASLAVTKFSMLHVCVLGKQQVASTYSKKKKKANFNNFTSTI